MAVRFGIWANAPSSMISSPAGRSMSPTLVNMNARSPIFLRVDGRVTPVMTAFSRKAR